MFDICYLDLFWICCICGTTTTPRPIHNLLWIFLYNKININNKSTKIEIKEFGLQRRANYGIKTMNWENKLTELHWHLHSLIISLIFMTHAPETGSINRLHFLEASFRRPFFVSNASVLKISRAENKRI